MSRIKNAYDNMLTHVEKEVEKLIEEVMRLEQENQELRKKLIELESANNMEKNDER